MSRRMDGTTLSDRYELHDQLGAGGMAEVYLGRDLVLGRTIAVKILLDQYAGDPHFIERFRREAQNAAALNHPNVVGVYDTGSDRGTHYIVMEYIEGRTLRDLIREEGPLLPERVAEIGADVCAGMSFAHQHGIVHRDIKPANIMMTPTGAVKVTDFGIARAVAGDTVTQTAMVLGTAQYFSPEQAQSRPVDARSDIYSLGCVLYEMLTRQVPFTGSSPVAIAYKHVKEDPILPSRLNPDVPAALEAIVMKSLAKNPDNRYQSAQEMREDLLRALHGRPVEATPVMTDATGMISMASDETIVLERRPGSSIRHDPTPEERRRRTGFILLAMIGIAMLGVAAWAASGLLGGAKQVIVPDVTGQSIEQATQTLSERGFKVAFLTQVFSADFKAGDIVTQDPIAGERVKEGSTIQLTPSKGKNLVTVPDLKGKSQFDAEALLKKAGLRLGRVEQRTDSSVRYGNVIEQTPGAGVPVDRRSRVDIVVSSGRPSQDVQSYVGYFESDAVDAIRAQGFHEQVIREDQSPTCQQEVGRVCRQSPSSGRVTQGSTITIYVAREPTDTSPSPSPSPSPTDTPTPTPSATTS